MITVALACVLPGAALGARATVSGSSILVDGRPFFPIMTWAQCAPEVEDNLALGVNVFLGSSCDNPEQLVNQIGGRAYIALDYERYAGREFSGLIGYHQPDEPDGYGIPPAGLPPLGGAGPGRLVFETLSYHISVAHPPLLGIGPAEYAQYVARADVIGFDLYPLTLFCGNPWIGIANVYDEQRELDVLAGGKPTFQWIETGALDGRCGGDPVGPSEIRAEAWLAVAGGASGIGWFTHGGTGNGATRFTVPAANRAAIAQVGRDLTALAPVLLSARRDIVAGRPVRVGGRIAGGTTWVIAVNPTRAPVSASVSSPGAGDGTASVWGEGRTVRIVDGGLIDDFGPLAVHVYDFHTASGPTVGPPQPPAPDAEPDRRGRHRRR